MLTDDELLALMKRVDPETKRVPPGVRAIANAIQATERERLAQRCEQVAAHELYMMTPREVALYLASVCRA